MNGAVQKVVQEALYRFCPPIQQLVRIQEFFQWLQLGEGFGGEGLALEHQSLFLIGSVIIADHVHRPQIKL